MCEEIIGRKLGTTWSPISSLSVPHSDSSLLPCVGTVVIVLFCRQEKYFCKRSVLYSCVLLMFRSLWLREATGRVTHRASPAPHPLLSDSSLPVLFCSSSSHRPVACKTVVLRVKERQRKRSQEQDRHARERAKPVSEARSDHQRNGKGGEMSLSVCGCHPLFYDDDEGDGSKTQAFHSMIKGQIHRLSFPSPPSPAA